MKRLIVLAIAAVLAFIYSNVTAQSKKEEKKITKDVQVTTDKNDNSMKVVTIINGDTTTKEFTFNTKDLEQNIQDAGEELDRLTRDFGNQMSSTFNISSNKDDNSVVISSGNKITKIIIETDDEKSDKSEESKISKKVIVSDEDAKKDELPISKTELKNKNTKEKKEKIVKKEVHYVTKEELEDSNDMQRSDIRFDEKDNTLMIDFWLPSSGDADVKVEDAEGKLLYDKKIEGKKAQYNREIQLKEKPKAPFKLSVKQKNFEIEKIK